MSTKTQSILFTEITLVLPTPHSPQFFELNDATSLFHRTSISGTLPSYSDTNVPSASSLSDIPALHLDLSECRLSVNETLSRGSLGSVHRGSFEGGSDAALAAASSPVIVKLVVGEDKIVLLRHEAIIYQYVKRLQGSVLPRNYGFYENRTHTAAFILLEDCGMPYSQSFDSISDGTKLALMQALKQLHDAGVEHGDLQPWNILDHQGSPCIVDWHLAMVHRCTARNQVMTEEFCCREGISELACEELVAVGERMMFRSQDQILYG